MRDTTINAQISKFPQSDYYWRSKSGRFATGRVLNFWYFSQIFRQVEVFENTPKIPKEFPKTLTTVRLKPPGERWRGNKISPDISVFATLTSSQTRAQHNRRRTVHLKWKKNCNKTYSPWANFVDRRQQIDFTMAPWCSDANALKFRWKCDEITKVAI